MNTSYLAYALEIERVGSITQAAQNLYMAQPNLSKALKELEKELGYPVFKRTALGVKATEEGEEFAREFNIRLFFESKIKYENSFFNLVLSGSFIFPATSSIEAFLSITISLSKYISLLTPKGLVSSFDIMQIL